MLLAQVSEERILQICGPPAENPLLCRWVLRSTENEMLAEAAGLLATGLRVIAILVVALILTMVLRRLVSRFSNGMEKRIQRRLERGERRGVLDAERYRSRRFQRLHAITGVLRGAVGVVVWLIALLIALDTMGVRLQPILAGAGLAGIVIGFGAQQLVRDVLAGISMLIEDQYGGGDWIDVDGSIGQVERVGLRATSFRDLDGVVWHVANGHIQKVGNLSQEWSRSLLDVPVALDADVPTAKAIIHKVATDLKQDPVWGPDIIGDPEIWGVQDFGPDGLAIRFVMVTKPMANWDINRQMRERLHHAFALANIRMQGKLIEVGGMATGYPVLQRRAGEPDDRRRRQAGLVPPEAGPLDGPPVDQERSDALAAIEEEDDHYGELPDRTTELRRDRGSSPRPD